jgi:response regulator RpfG family c-di-GMP phosphodiesterase
VADELVRCSGTQFDPAVVDAFFEVPVGEWMEIRTNCAESRLPFFQPSSETGVPARQH